MTKIIKNNKKIYRQVKIQLMMMEQKKLKRKKVLDMETINHQIQNG
jgi:hypothetical protein